MISNGQHKAFDSRAVGISYRVHVYAAAAEVRSRGSILKSTLEGTGRLAAGDGASALSPAGSRHRHLAPP